MGLLDPVFRFLAALGRAIGRATDFVDDTTEAVTNPSIDGQQASEVVGELIADTSPADEIGAALTDTVEEAILADLQDAGELTPENVERVTDQTEGGAVAVLTGLGLAGSGVEAASLGQVDQHQEYITQALAGLGVDDVTGLELDARINQGIAPALEAKVAAEHRPQFVNLQDNIEYHLRNKESDTGFTDGIATYGIRPDEVEKIERVALREMEFEELIETPAELGLVVPDDVLEQQLDLAGYPEATKDFLGQVNDRIPRTTRAYEEFTSTEELVNQLDTLVDEGELTPAEARARLPAEADTAADALEQRFQLLDQLPQGSPTRSLIEESALYGLSDLSTLESRLSRLEYDTDTYSDVLDVTLLDALDSELQEAVALGLVSEGLYGGVMDQLGVQEEAQRELMAGGSFTDVVDRVLGGVESDSEVSVASVPGIGESRAFGLQAEGIETVADLAEADVETVAAAAEVSPETAADLISLAESATG